jgi:hypothetical protein
MTTHLFRRIGVDRRSSPGELGIMTRIRTLVFVAAICGMAGQASAAIVDVLRYRLGEPGSFSGQLPIDTVGGRDMTNSLGTFTPGGVTDTMDPAYSTNATAFASVNSSGNYGASSAGLPDDNFAVEIWARTTVVDQAFKSFFSLNAGSTGSLMFHIGGDTWSASYFGVAWIGPESGLGEFVSPNAWTNLAVIRSQGNSTFYINGVAQTGTTNAAPSYGATDGIHLAVTPGATLPSDHFTGDLDEARIFTFDPLTDNPVAALSVNAVPEPASVGLVAAGMAGLAWLRWRRRAGA